METSSSIMPLCATMFLSMSAVTKSGVPDITGGRGIVRPARMGRDRGPSSRYRPLTASCFTPPISAE